MERLYYLSHWLYCHKVPVLPRILMLVIRLLYQSYIPYKTRIPGVSFGHTIGVVLALGLVIGAHCKIRHHVTVADGKGSGARVGEEVEIGAGVFILNNLTIGSRARIGANTVVVKDVPDDATVAGNLGRVVRIKCKQAA